MFVVTAKKHVVVSQIWIFENDDGDGCLAQLDLFCTAGTNGATNEFLFTPFLSMCYIVHGGFSLLRQARFIDFRQDLEWFRTEREMAFEVTLTSEEIKFDNYSHIWFNLMLDFDIGNGQCEFSDFTTESCSQLVVSRTEPSVGESVLAYIDLRDTLDHGAYAEPR